jgi:hypothetical protein
MEALQAVARHDCCVTGRVVGVHRQLPAMHIPVLQGVKSGDIWHEHPNMVLTGNSQSEHGYEGTHPRVTAAVASRANNIALTIRIISMRSFSDCGELE